MAVTVKPEADTNNSLTHMFLSVLLTAALVAASHADSHANQVAEDSGRLFITGTGNPNQSVVIGNGSMVLFGLVTLAFVIALVAAAFSDRGTNFLSSKAAS